MNDNLGYKILWLFILFAIYFGYNYYFSEIDNNEADISYVDSDIPNYSDKDLIILNNNEPDFDDLAKTSESFEVYSELDSLGRTGVAYANLGKELMPTSERKNISMVKPTGWNYSKYDFIEGNLLYNRCHLIAFSLAGENANPNNLITCTRHMNAEVMLKYENKVGNYIRKTNNHVLYRVTPVYDGNNLLAKGVQMEALSVEDNGKGIKFNVFIYNVEPKVEINYTDGSNKLTED